MVPPLITVDIAWGLPVAWVEANPATAALSSLRRRHGALALDDEPVGVRLAVLGEIEDRVAITLAEIEIAARGDHLVLERDGLRDDLSGRGDDGALADHVGAFLDPAFGGADHPSGILVGTGLHRQVVVELGQAVDVAVAGVVVGG